MASAKQKTRKQKNQGAGVEKDGANRRRFDRRDTHIVAQLNYNDMSVDGMVTNLSLEGCLFAPRIDIPVGGRVKLKLAGEHKAVPATVKAVSELGVHCLLHAGGATLGRLSVEVDDMALLMLNASRPHVVVPASAPAKSTKRKKAAKKKVATKKAVAPAKKKAVKKAAPKKKAGTKTKAGTKNKAVTKKTPVAKKPVLKKKAVKGSASKKRR